MLRAAAKNHRHVLVITSHHQYSRCLELLKRISSEELAQARREFASSVFAQTATYDQVVANYLRGERTAMLGARRPESSRTSKTDVTRVALRYGENPHQEAFYGSSRSAPVEGVIRPDALVSGSELSFNNYVDATASWDLCCELERSLAAESAGEPATPSLATVVFVKHTNACGVGVDRNPTEAYRRAYLGDPNAAMGGVLSCSSPVTASFAEVVMKTYARWGKAAGAGGFFVEVWSAPSFDPAAIELIQTTQAWGQRVRLLSIGSPPAVEAGERLVSRDLPGGVLEQSPDTLGLNEADWNVASARQPTEKERSDLRLAWLICKHTKSNAITICRDGMLLGNGAGQMSRVMSCRIASWAAKENGHSDRLCGSVAASDAFFPFSDGPEILFDAGVTALIQPGGSKRDDETIRLCDARGAALMMTGTRHFRH
jgi:phosphoribosylaminoimidazolecarboxamide formyltransferase/IMP cyclohydrolase